MGGKTQKVKVPDVSEIFEMNDATNCFPKITMNIPKAVVYINSQVEEVIKKERKELKELKEERDRQTAVSDVKRLDKEISERETLVADIKETLNKSKRVLKQIQ